MEGGSSLGLCCPVTILVFSLSTRLYTSPFARRGSQCEHRRALEQEEERTGTHKTQTTSPSLIEFWCRVVWE